MAINDVYQIVDEGLLTGQKCLNVYFYFMETSVPGQADALHVAEGYIANLLPSVVAVQASQFVHTSVRVKNLYDATDAHEELISVPGAGASQINSNFDAYGFRLVGDNASVRSGAKRIPAVIDADVADGVVVDAGLLANLAALGVVLSTTMTFGTLDAGTLLPVIVKRILTGTEYRLPANSGETVLSHIIDALVDIFVTSQTSRKVGRGE